eukprot:Selendium_serpulae@DN4395_c0_g1_i2.p1
MMSNFCSHQCYSQFLDFKAGLKIDALFQRPGCRDLPYRLGLQQRLPPLTAPVVEASADNSRSGEENQQAVYREQHNPDKPNLSTLANPCPKKETNDIERGVVECTPAVSEGSNILEPPVEDHPIEVKKDLRLRGSRWERQGRPQGMGLYAYTYGDFGSSVTNDEAVVNPKIKNGDVVQNVPSVNAEHNCIKDLPSGDASQVSSEVGIQSPQPSSKVLPKGDEVTELPQHEQENDGLTCNKISTDDEHFPGSDDTSEGGDCGGSLFDFMASSEDDTEVPAQKASASDAMFAHLPPFIATWDLLTSWVTPNTTQFLTKDRMIVTEPFIEAQLQRRKLLIVKVTSIIPASLACLVSDVTNLICTFQILKALPELPEVNTRLITAALIGVLIGAVSAPNRFLKDESLQSLANAFVERVVEEASVQVEDFEILTQIFYQSM